MILKVPLIKRSSHEPASTEEALRYIKQYWPRLLRENKQDDGSLIGLPNPYLIPSDDGHDHFLMREQYYWDTYFTALGLIGKEHEALVSGMLENLLVLFKRFGSIPNASRMYFTSRSQPPILTTLIFHVYETYGKSNTWLEEHIAIAEEEYRRVWMATQHPQWHQVYRGLSRYYDVNVLHDLAEAESGWDMTPRFERKCLDYLPVDLNALLFKYEMDFARAADIAGQTERAAGWRRQAQDRKEAMDELMWGKLRGFYFDYNYQKKELGSIWSLAAYYTLWAGMANQEQADKLVASLPKFERKGGLTTTTRPLIDMSMFGSLKTQWAYPNGWAPLHAIVIDGLERYGYHDHAARIARKWLRTNLAWYEKHAVFIEKYNVVSPTKPPVEGVYPSQTGFGWTNGVFVYLSKRYS